MPFVIGAEYAVAGDGKRGCRGVVLGECRPSAGWTRLLTVFRVIRGLGNVPLSWLLASSIGPSRGRDTLRSAARRGPGACYFRRARKLYYEGVRYTKGAFGALLGAFLHCLNAAEGRGI